MFKCSIQGGMLSSSRASPSFFLRATVHVHVGTCLNMEKIERCGLAYFLPHLQQHSSLVLIGNDENISVWRPWTQSGIVRYYRFEMTIACLCLCLCRQHHRLKNGKRLYNRRKIILTFRCGEMSHRLVAKKACLVRVCILKWHHHLHY